MVYVIIVGGGAVGLRTAEILSQHGILVTVIEKDKRRAETIMELTKANVIVGDATDPHVIERAEINKSNYFIAVTGDDKTNVISAVLAKNYGVENIIVRLTNPTFQEICHMIGIPHIINPAESIAIQIDAIIRGIKFVDFVRIAREDIDVEEVHIREDNYDGKTIKYIKEKSKDIIYPLMVIRKNKILIPSDDLKLHNKDKLMILRKRRRLPF